MRVMKKKLFSVILAALMTVQVVAPASAELEDTDEFMIEESVDEQTPEETAPGDSEILLGDLEDPELEEEDLADTPAFMEDAIGDFFEERKDLRLQNKVLENQ